MAPSTGALALAALTIVGTFFVSQYYVHDLKTFWPC